MKAELENKLMEKYPAIFQQKDLPMTQTCMCWGIECGDGWYGIIDYLCKMIMMCEEDKIDTPEEKEGMVCQATQVKEKYGGLRFYVCGANDEQWKYIEAVELMSYGVCENCGTTIDVHQTKGWISSLCPKCMRKKRI